MYLRVDWRRSDDNDGAQWPGRANQLDHGLEVALVLLDWHMLVGCLYSSIVGTKKDGAQVWCTARLGNEVGQLQYSPPRAVGTFVSASGQLRVLPFFSTPSFQARKRDPEREFELDLG